MKTGPHKEPRRSFSTLARLPLALLAVPVAALGCAPSDAGDIEVVRGAGIIQGAPPLLVKPGTHTAHGEIFSCAMVQNANKSGLKCWGYNGSGQLGLGDTVARGDNPNEMGNNLPFVSLGASRSATALALGREFACALLDNAQVKCWGANGQGQLGKGDTLTRGNAAGQMGDALTSLSFGAGHSVKAIAAGFRHACAILDDDTVKCWGGNESGQLGLGDTASRGDNANEMGDALPTVALGAGRKAKALALGGTSSCAILDNDKLKCWGGNLEGQLGLGDTVNRGDNAGEMGDSLPVVSLGTNRIAKSVSMDYHKACAILDDSSLKCWGGNLYGQLGLGNNVSRGDNTGEMGDSLPVVSLGTGRTAKAIVGTGVKTCALLDNNTVKCWGNASSSWGLGYGDKVNRGGQPGQMGDALPAIDFGSGPTGKAYTATSLGGGGASFAPSTQEQFCAVIAETGSTKCWGPNFFGQIGLGQTGNPLGDNPNEMGDFLPYLDLGT
jgi:alpha-tubulin suppressor-like RCC1 family protein